MLHLDSIGARVDNGEDETVVDTDAVVVLFAKTEA